MKPSGVLRRACGLVLAAYPATWRARYGDELEEVLDQLGVAGLDGARLIEIWNKIDQLDGEKRARIHNLAARRPAEQRPVLVSALNGEGIERLVSEIEARLATRRVMFDLVLSVSDGAGLSWLHRHTEVMAKHVRDDAHLVVTVRADPANAEKARAKFARPGAP